MKVTKIENVPVQKPAYAFKLDLTAEGFWRVFPSMILYGLQTAPNFTACDASGNNCVYSFPDYDAHGRGLFIGFDLRQIRKAQGSSKSTIDVLMAVGEKKLIDHYPFPFEVEFKDGFGRLGFQGISLVDGPLTAEFSMDKAPLFTFTVPIVNGLPTGDAGVTPSGRPVLTKKFEHDAQGRILKIIEGNTVKLIERDASGKMVGILET